MKKVKNYHHERCCCCFHWFLLDFVVSHDSLSIFKVEYKIEVATPLEKTKIKMSLRVSVVEQSSTLINSVALTGKTVFRIQVPEEKFINFNFNIGIV